MTKWKDITTPLAAGLSIFAEDISFTLEEVATATTLTTDHYMIAVDASSGNLIITLPAAASHTNRIYTIKKIDSSENTVTIDANSTETIDGEETIVLKLQYSYITIICDGDEWFIIGGEYVKMEDKLDDIEDVLQSSLDRQEKSLLILGKLEKHADETDTVEIDEGAVVEDINDSMPDIED